MSTDRLICDAIRVPLESLGFTKRTVGIFTIPISDDVIGVLGLNTARRHQPPGVASVNPIIGVRHQTLERLLAKLQGEKFRLYAPATIVRPLGYLLPSRQHTTWIFDAAQDNSHAALEMTEAITAYGLPLMRSFRGVAEVAEALEPGSSSTPFLHNELYKRPVASLLLGKTQKAEEDLDHGLREMGKTEQMSASPYAADFRRFAAALRAYLHTTDSHS